LTRIPAVLKPIRIDPAALTLQPLELDPSAFQSALPVQNYAVVFKDDDIGMAVGVWDTTTMQETFGPYPGDEFITVLDGRFRMVSKSGTTQAAAQAGQSVAFRNAIPTSWKQVGYLRKVYLTLQPPGAETPVLANARKGLRVLDPSRTPKSLPGPGGVVHETLFRNDAGTMEVAQCLWPAAEHPAAPAKAHELIRLLSGELSLTDETGTVHRCVAGDHMFVPRGTVCARRTAAGTAAFCATVTA
jgi:uncharacterized cupin superfamily protein